MNANSQRLDQPLIPGSRGGLSAGQVWRIISGRAFLILGITLAFVLLTALVTVMMSKVYQADVSLLIDFQDDDPVTGRTAQQFVADGYFATQVDILKSRKVRDRVVQELGLAADPEAREEFQSNSGDGASFEDWLAGRVLDNMDVETGRGSRILDLLYFDENPRRAAEIANAIARAYKDISIGLIEEPARQRQTRYTEYLEKLGNDVEAAQTKLTTVRQELKVVDVGDDGSFDTQRLSDLGVRLNEAQAERQAAQARVQRIREMQRRGKSLTAQADILDSRYVQELKGRLVQLESQRSELGETLGRNHPRMQSLSAEITTVRSRLRQEIGSYVEADRGEAQTAASRENGLRKTLEGERRDILSLQEKRDQIAKYERELGAAKLVYDAAVGNYDQVLGNSLLQQTNISVIHWASVPEKPVRPNTKFNLIVGFILGLLMGLGAAFLLELVGRRLRSDEDIERELDLEVLGVIPR